MTNVSFKRVLNEIRQKFTLRIWFFGRLIAVWLCCDSMKALWNIKSHVFHITSKCFINIPIFQVRTANRNNHHPCSNRKCRYIDIRCQRWSSTYSDPWGDISHHLEAWVKMQLEQSFCFTEFMSVITKAAEAEIKSRLSRRIVLRAGEWGCTNHPFHLTPCKSMKPSSGKQHHQPIN